MSVILSRLSDKILCLFSGLDEQEIDIIAIRNKISFFIVGLIYKVFEELYLWYSSITFKDLSDVLQYSVNNWGLFNNLKAI